MKSVSEISIDLDSLGVGVKLWIYARKTGTLFDVEQDASEHNEARFQLVEGCFYDYELSENAFILGDVGENIIHRHKRTHHLGTIAPNIFVGTLSIPVLNKETNEECLKVELEVQSIKSGYREDYRDMLELITEKCTDLLFQANSPVSHHFEVDYSNDSQTNYQRFAFIKSIIGSNDFADSVHKIVTSPVTKWADSFEEKDIRNARRFTNSNLREILKGGKRTSVPMKHYLRDYGLETLPERITTIRKVDSVDTPENRFVKHALESFLKFSTDMNSIAFEHGHQKLLHESENLIRELESKLHHSIFNSISTPTTLKLNSPVLQRKEGYREVLRVWLMFDLAAKLIWKGGDDIYSGGKKDIATLYEYWLFFILLDLFQSMFKIKSKDVADLIQYTSDGLNLQIKQGKFTALEGVCDLCSRKLNIKFSYNRSFSGNKSYPSSGSWTSTLRPDYTLSFWPNGISEEDAEVQELIVHIHFDAKYKISNLNEIINQNVDNNLDTEKVDNRKGVYKNADLLKMHAYKDAIRRTGGAYVLYPGDKSIKQKGFHEVIPGLGAFPIRPSKSDNGIGELKAFILDIIKHFLNRSSQREKIAFRTFDIFKNPPNSNDFLNEIIPESFHENRGLIPDETFVLVGFYKNTEHLNWINKRKLYNFRMDNEVGSLTLSQESLSSKYLLLHTSGDNESSELWKIVGKGFRVTSMSTMKRLNYPNPKQNNYLVVKVQKVTESEFENLSWRFRELENYRPGRASALPFTVSLSELMSKAVRK